MPPVVTEPLSAARFAPYGEVLQNDGAVRRNYYSSAVTPGQAPGELRFWVSRVEPAADARVTIMRLERHPFSAQTFLPMKIARWLIVVASALPDGKPDISQLRAFMAGPGTGICYRRGTWHHGTTVLDETGMFGVLMWRRTAGDDDEFHDLAEPIAIDTGGCAAPIN